MGLHSERQKHSQYVGTILKGPLKDFSVSLMRWIGNYAREEDYAS